jgi:hypothetical protein
MTARTVRPIVWVPTLRATLRTGLRWARSNRAQEAAATSAAAPGPVASTSAKAKGASTWTLGPRPSRLRDGQERGRQHDQGQHGRLGLAPAQPVEVDVRREQAEQHDSDRRDDGGKRPIWS